MTAEIASPKGAAKVETNVRRIVARVVPPATIATGVRVVRPGLPAGDRVVLLYGRPSVAAPI